MANQVEMLLSVKSRLETELSQLKKEHKREVSYIIAVPIFMMSYAMPFSDL